MVTTASRPPGHQRLVRGLSALAQGNGRVPVRVLAREPADLGSTFATEVVTCTVGGRKVRLFCKYGFGRRPHPLKDYHRSYGHRGGVRREAAVYRALLEPLGLSHARFLGAYHEAATGQTWLVLEYLDGGERLVRAYPQATGMTAAAGWIGRFHAAAARARQLPRLTAYDARYYRGWARRAARFGVPWRRRFRWLEPLCERFGAVADELAALPRTVIHGEYYPKNIVLRKRRIYPVDWESAAIAVGQIDLAALTEEWGPEVERRCVAAYRRARWPEGAPANFARGLDAARLYLVLRWLGDHPLSTRDGDVQTYFEQLRPAGERLGLI